MSEATTGVLILGGLVVMSSLLCHRFISPLWRAAVIASAVSAILFQVVVTIQLGHLDKFFIVALQFSFLYGFLGSMAIGYFMRLIGIAATPRDAT